MTNPLDLKHLGKLGEEVDELGSAIFRCIIQGIDEAEPITGKVNRHWVEDEIADVLANIELVSKHFGLDRKRIEDRMLRKMSHLRGWHSMIAGDAANGKRVGDIVAEVFRNCGASWGLEYPYIHAHDLRNWIIWHRHTGEVVYVETETNPTVAKLLCEKKCRALNGLSDFVDPETLAEIDNTP